ncbi:MAG: hypothetical protein KF838_02025 [Phycisphaeraceae bacterium]|nr:MAG: hypothetical protein KF838_02025 [Phycisphaeraceae bacterium]
MRRTGIAIALLAVLGGMAYAGIRIASRSWQATIRVHGDQVRVMLNGQAVDPDHIEWLPDGRCLVTVNGGRVLIDPKQPGGASATISVDHHDD